MTPGECKYKYNTKIISHRIREKLKLIPLSENFVIYEKKSPNTTHLEKGLKGKGRKLNKVMTKSPPNIKVLLPHHKTIIHIGLLHFLYSYIIIATLFFL